MASTSISPEVLEAGGIYLGEEVEKGLVPAQVAFIKESTLEVNEELLTAGQCIRAVAAHLFEIKQNVRPGNWKAYLRSGALNCSERYAVDLVNAHEKWLGNSDVDDHLLAGFSARSLNAMGGKGITDRERAKVFDLAAKGEVLSDAKVRNTLRGRPSAKSKVPKTVDARVEELNNRLKVAIKKNKELIAENKKLRDLVAQGGASKI
ncbi:hypothetical protein [Prochlorococcus sp. MIT 1307]|uniref:hypothetical protein n=1 Tax=Prochlorococcus sp. MIT 1307 TaxID=3096219 RepID=UPI002A757B59|nr:hypothetical protein [Prochlorococcus sp. MIT 1307]